jgi:hypothetical protein
MVNKKCTKCDAVKDIDNFSKHSKYKDGYQNTCKDCIKETTSKHRKNIKYKLRFRNYQKEYNKNKKSIDSLFKLQSSIRTRISQTLSGYSKSKHTEEILGCSFEEFKKHIESLWGEGMTWDNYGTYGWHIDHIIPVSSALTENEVYTLNHYTNLQPLWWKENLEKSNKIL